MGHSHHDHSPAPAKQGAALPLTRVALIGNPNTGKTSLFNWLCGARAKTANFPGTTTATRIGRSQLPGKTIEVIDLPGLYALSSPEPETRIVKDVLEGAAHHQHVDAVVVLVDAGNLGRNLVLVGELIARHVPVVIALNMIDLAKRRGLVVDAAVLSSEIGAPVVPTIASKAKGVAEVQRALAALLESPASLVRQPASPPRADSIESLTDWAHGIADTAYGGSPGHQTLVDQVTDRIDRTLTHPLWGTVAFLVVMGGIFWSLFALARVPMALIDATFAQLGALVTHFLPPGPVRALLINGVIGGVAGTIIFLPQICLLFFLISLLEDTGYLARAAFVNDRFFQRFGLPGQAFLPLLTSHACAIPGIMSARLISDRRDRLTTILIAPFMSCSARLPVYVLLTSLLFARRPFVASVAFAGCYVLGAAAAFSSAFLFGQTVLKGRAQPMILELPGYKMPSLRNALLTAKDQGIAFLKTAGTIVMAICVVMWWLSAYPRVATPPQATELRQEAASSSVSADRAQALSTQADAIEARAQQTGSFVGRMGRLVEPVFRPLGYDWQLTVGILTSFIAREVFVSTMSVLAGATDERGVVDHVREMPRDDGTPVFTRATAASTLVFFVLAMQCLPTLAVTRKETGATKYALVQFAYMSTVAYVVAFAVYQTIRLLGVV